MFYISLVKKKENTGKPTWDDFFCWKFEEFLEKHGYIPNNDGMVTKECIFSFFEKYNDLYNMPDDGADFLSEYAYLLMKGYLSVCEPSKKRPVRVYMIRIDSCYSCDLYRHYAKPVLTDSEVLGIFRIIQKFGV